MTLQKAILELPPVDVDGDGSDETGIFHFVGNLEISMQTRTGYLVGGRGGKVNSIIANTAKPGQSKNKEIIINAGLGQRVIEVDFDGWEGSVDQSGNPLQWGDTGDTGTVTPADATGADALTQLQVLDHYLQVATPGSLTPAKLQVGEYSSGGLFDTPDLGLDHLKVAVEGPSLSKAARDPPDMFSGSMTFIEITTSDEVIDAANRTVVK